MTCLWRRCRGRGRVEKRTTIATDWVDWLPGRAEWRGLAGLVMVTRRRQTAKKTSEETSFYLTSRPGVDVEELGRAIRSHWGVENELHWSLDVVFREDASRVRKDHGPENLAIIRRIVLNLVRQETSVKASLKGKRSMAGWNEQCLLKILGFGHMR
jgi:predicted transposase YbfD/YdcC